MDARWAWSCDDPRTLESLGLEVVQEAAVTRPPPDRAGGCRAGTGTRSRWPGGSRVTWPPSRCSGPADWLAIITSSRFECAEHREPRGRSLLRFGASWQRFCDHEPMPSRRMEWAVAGALAGWAAARLAGADRLRFAEAWAVPLLSFTPQVAAGAWASALLLRGTGPAAVTAVAGAALTAAVGPRAVPYRQPPAAGPVLRVLTANLLVGRAGAEAVVELVCRKHADVLFVQELTDEAAARLQRAGLCDLLPHRVTQPMPNGTRGRHLRPLPAARRAARLRRCLQPGAPPGLTFRPGSSCNWPAYTRCRRSRPGPRALRPGGAVSCPRCLRPVTVRVFSPETSTPPSTTRSSAGSCAAATWTPPARLATGCP